jgi:uncharacterized protein YdhG (YjbR/CyaY superfamily)
MAKIPTLQKKVTDDIRQWVSETESNDPGQNHSVRVKIAEKGMVKVVRQKTLSDLAKNTKSRMNNGQKEYLLHRVMSDEEATQSNIHNGSYQNNHYKRKIGNQEFTPYTSWSPKIVPLYPADRNHIVSAWVPENHVSFYPKAYIKSKLLDESVKDIINDKDEVIIKHGNFEILHYTPFTKDFNKAKVNHVNDYYSKFLTGS